LVVLTSDAVVENLAYGFGDDTDEEVHQHHGGEDHSEAGEEVRAVVVSPYISNLEVTKSHHELSDILAQESLIISVDVEGERVRVTPLSIQLDSLLDNLGRSHREGNQKQEYDVCQN